MARVSLIVVMLVVMVLSVVMVVFPPPRETDELQSIASWGVRWGA